jgi:hypothetical protein
MATFIFQGNILACTYGLRYETLHHSIAFDHFTYGLRNAVYALPKNTKHIISMHDATPNQTFKSMA